ncbi:MAG: hypothetical protein ACREBF_00865 [Candidatus Micrarchaeales archaeon]
MSHYTVLSPQNKILSAHILILPSKKGEKNADKLREALMNKYNEVTSARVVTEMKIGKNDELVTTGLKIEADALINKRKRDSFEKDLKRLKSADGKVGVSDVDVLLSLARFH